MQTSVLESENKLLRRLLQLKAKLQQTYSGFISMRTLILFVSLTTIIPQSYAGNQNHPIYRKGIRRVHGDFLVFLFVFVFVSLCYYMLYTHCTVTFILTETSSKGASRPRWTIWLTGEYNALLIIFYTCDENQLASSVLLLFKVTCDKTESFGQFKKSFQNNMMFFDVTIFCKVYKKKTLRCHSNTRVITNNHIHCIDGW